MNQDPTYQHIERYLEGRMSSEERSTFEAQLKKDPDLAKSLKLQEETLKALDVYNQLNERERVKSIYERVKTEEKKHPSRLFYRVAAAIAFLLATGTFFYYMGFQHSNNRIAEQHFTPYEDRITQMGTVDAKQALQQGLRAYNQNNFAGAVHYLQAVEEDSEQYSDAQFYLGVSFLAQGEARQAIEILKVTSVPDNSYEEPARWYLALSYLAADEPEKARPLLETFAAREASSYKRTEAQHILKKMNSFWRKWSY